ncbi:hypothetical protein RHSIM_Rhsim05G0148500 [Rhododendron simsii]|uniref:Uncharacterized protein n=1 Tax=Rhododendron simsii TaxID=118357 RepID=A0A834LNK2_RHOSS|nr:hypothetical protein RHSIM_Rhsim05G0148500 [Rhododendron simsii]
MWKRKTLEYLFIMCIQEVFAALSILLVFIKWTRVVSSTVMWTSLEVCCQRLAWILNYASDELSSGVSLAMGQSIWAVERRCPHFVDSTKLKHAIFLMRPRHLLK